MAGRRKSPGMTNDIYITMIPVSIVTGIIAWFLCNRLYSSILDLLPRPLVIGIVFVVLYALLLIVVVVVAILGHEYQGNAITFLLIYSFSVHIRTESEIADVRTNIICFYHR